VGAKATTSDIARSSPSFYELVTGLKSRPPSLAARRMEKARQEGRADFLLSYVAASPGKGTNLYRPSQKEEAIW